MLQLSEKSLIFAASSCDGWQALRRAMKLWPARESANSKYKGEKSDSCFSCGSIYTAYSAMGVGSHIHLQVWADFILTYTGIAEPSG